MVKTFFRRKKRDISGLPVLIELNHKCFNIEMIKFAYPKQVYETKEVIESHGRRLEKRIRTCLYQALLNQDFFSQGLYITDLELNGKTMLVNGRSYFKFTLVVYAKEVTSSINYEVLDTVLMPVMDIITENEFFYFKNNLCISKE